jgi:hypothetical protein
MSAWIVSVFAFYSVFITEAILAMATAPTCDAPDT